ncbi:MAG TPA: S24 family peptidase [Thermoanaerobaculia bacterium]|jgi:SOS-response transcriptional repressor LexA|nr:S24 family peptidase [Thermoanaerobaculia bacterium]
MDWVDRLRQAVDAKGKHSLVAVDAGIHPSSLSEIINRAARPQFETIIDLCRVCDVTVGWILGEQGFELGDADYEQITAIQGWTAQKLEERNARSLVKSRRPERTVSVLPAVATPRGETWTDPDEISDRDIPREYQNQGANAVFVTRGDSMTDAGIFEGDFLFVRKSRNWRVANQHVVVCRLEGTFTVKRLVVQKDTITLVSAKQGVAPVIINEEAERFELIGIVVGVSRDLAGDR